MECTGLVNDAKANEDLHGKGIFHENFIEKFRTTDYKLVGDYWILLGVFTEYLYFGLNLSPAVPEPQYPFIEGTWTSSPFNWVLV